MSMSSAVSARLIRENEARIFPFLWLHGEDEATLRDYMRAIRAAGIRAVCVESRPHPDFHGDRWWREPWRPGRCEQQLRPERFFDDDRIISVAKADGGRVAVCHVTRNRGPHRVYINMLSEASCRVLIDTVYKAHYARYAGEFGATIAGFFSDEPEFGNDHLYEYGKRLWELDDLPWSDAVEQKLRQRWGEHFERRLPLLWQAEGREAARARYDYMDVAGADVLLRAAGKLVPCPWRGAHRPHHRGQQPAHPHRQQPGALLPVHVGTGNGGD